MGRVKGEHAKGRRLARRFTGGGFVLSLVISLSLLLLPLLSLLICHAYMSC